MPMRFVTSVEGLIGEIKQATGQIRKALNDQMEAEAIKVRDIARDMVPELAGDVSRAITVENAGLRRKWVVYVNENEPTTRSKYKRGGGAWTVGEYMTWLHDYPFYNLGPLSQAKQARVRYRVGPKYLERAFQQRTSTGLIGRLTAAARRLGILN